MKPTFENVAEEIKMLHTKKNDNYGNSYTKLFDDLGEIAGLVPLHNKLDRLTNLVKNPNTENFYESKEDTLLDLASYAIMMVVELRRKEDEKTSIIGGEKTDDRTVKSAPGIINLNGMTCDDLVYRGPLPSTTSDNYFTYTPNIKLKDLPNEKKN